MTDPVTVDLDALERAVRLERMGIVVRSPELLAQAEAQRAFVAAGGNRAMRRSARRRARRA